MTENRPNPSFPRISADPALNSYNNNVERFNSVEDKKGTSFLPVSVFETQESYFIEDYSLGREIDKEIDPDHEMWVKAAQRALNPGLGTGDTVQMLVWDYGSSEIQADLYDVELSDRPPTAIPSGMDGKDYYDGKLMATGTSDQRRMVDFSVTALESEINSDDAVNLQDWR